MMKIIVTTNLMSSYDRVLPHRTLASAFVESCEEHFLFRESTEFWDKEVSAT